MDMGEMATIAPRARVILKVQLASPNTWRNVTVEGNVKIGRL